MAAPLSNAALFSLYANLLGANEVPPNGSAATGSASFLLDTTAQTLTGHIEFSGLNPLTAAGAPSGTTAAHIHCCLPTSLLPGVNVGVATLVPAFPGFPLGVGVLSGSDDFILDLTLASSYNSAFITAQGNLANAEAAFIAGLTSGRTYLNIHTTAFPGGEIRGFVVPEPMTVSLIALGLAAAGFASRRRKPL
jgi:hypothetical protein